MTDAPAPVLASSILQSLRDGVILADPAGMIMWVNGAFTAITGYSLAEVAGRPLPEVLCGTESRTDLAAAIAEHRAIGIDVSNRGKDGQVYVVAVELSPLPTPAGGAAHLAALLRDVTSERALAEAQVDFRAYRRALDQQAIVSVADRRGKITYVNEKFCKISGYEAAELLGKSHRIVNSGTHDRGFFATMWSEIRAGRTWHGEVCNRSKSGELYWVDTTVVPVEGPNGEILRYVSIRYEITERKRFEADLRRMAEFDALTGLVNRSQFLRTLHVRLTRAMAGDAAAGGLSLMIDLDHFKDINDTMGHRYGDLLLRKISDRLRAAIGEGAVAARLGGDEFGLILPKLPNGAETEAQLDRLRETAGAPVTLFGNVYNPSFSIGATRFPDDGTTVEEIMANADIALHEAKRNGRNQWRFFTPEAREHVVRRHQIKAILTRAIADESFDIVLQPTVLTATRQHVGFEVLVRLSHDGEPIPPDQFVPIAEDLGLISAIGRIVMAKASAVYRHWTVQGLAPGKLALNVAAPQFRDQYFVEDVQDMILAHGLDPAALVLEITETALIGRSTEVVAQALNRLRGLGVRVALDDFGTGFSSLAHLKDFAVDIIKIDKSFVQYLHCDPSGRALVEGLVRLANGIGLEVVAEGVEAEAHLDFLHQVGCSFAQGFHIAKPMPPDDAEAWLRAQTARSQVA